jgi:cell wall-associated NlpC family hydrolase
MARSSLPPRRVSAAVAPGGRGQFASLLRQASLTAAAPVMTPASHRPLSIGTPRIGGGASPMALSITNAPLLPAPAPAPAPVAPAAPTPSHGGPTPITRDEILANAQRLLDVPYVWGGTTGGGLDCSAYVSQVWGISHHTTDTLSQVTTRISKDDLQAGDALNLTIAADPSGYGHVRLFDKWADAAHTRMWVYEETPPRSVHHVIPWDSRYMPMRRQNVVESL